MNRYQHLDRSIIRVSPLQKMVAMPTALTKEWTFKFLLRVYINLDKQRNQRVLQRSDKRLLLPSLPSIKTLLIRRKICMVARQSNFDMEPHSLDRCLRFQINRIR